MSGIILVRDIMAKNVKTVRTDDSVLDAVVKMNKFNVGSVFDWGIRLDGDEGAAHYVFSSDRAGVES